MGCVDSKQKPHKENQKTSDVKSVPPPKLVSQVKPVSEAKPGSNVQGSSIKSPKKILSAEEAEKRRQEMLASMAEGNSKPPMVNLPKIPTLSFCEPPIYNEIIPGSQQPGFTPIYRQKGIKKLQQTPYPEIRTIGDIIRQCKNKFGHKNGLGQIIVTSEKSPNGQDIQIRRVKEYTYNQIYDLAYNLGRALTYRKLSFRQSLYGMNILGIYSRNRLQWFVTDWACSLFGFVLAPLYDTLGKQNLAHCISITGTTTLFVSQNTAEQLLKFHQKGPLKTLITFDKLPAELAEKLRAEGLQILNFRDLIEEGSKLHISNQYDVYSFCFTSGTTGPPKAGMIKHKNIISGLIPFIFHKDISFHSQDTYLSYLPLPHLMERTISNAIFLAGASLIVSSGNMQKIKDDAAAAHITIFVSVPRVYNRIADNVKTTLVQMITDETKRQQIQKAVYQKVRQSFGGKIRILATGSAPINPQVQQLLQKIMGAPMIQGYGQTQCPVGFLFSHKTMTDFGVLDQISAGVELRLADIPQMKYTSKDKDSQGRPTPRGEICARGHQVFGGYYKMQELSKQTVGADGWLRTGDVAEITPQLGFKIIDRKKNIFKLQHGEYIAPDRVEAYYMNSGLIEQIFLCGDSLQNYAVAIISPKKEKITQIAAKLGLHGSIEEICQNRNLRIALLQELNTFVRQKGLASFQAAKNIYLQTIGFASRNILTNTQKLIRFQAKNSYKSQIEAMYAQGELKI